ncbi:aquaporin [Candidatus Saccharibacteria bacterium]|nr:aquaporin [Candidatus Saccharibacteria bacterium]
MAANKPKKTATKSKAKTKTAVKSEKTEKPAIVAAEKKVEKNEKTTKTEKKTEGSKFFKTFFAKKCDASENILTIFHDKKLYGALIGEVVGTMLLSIILLTLGVYQPLYMFFVFVGVILLTFGLSGANLNPIVTAGMMATRRMSAIRGVLYLLAQILGAWVGYLIVSAFVNAGAMGAELPKMTAVEPAYFWVTTMIEFFGATIIGFSFARALQYKRSALTFAMICAGGIVTALIAVIVISSSYIGLSSNFMLNPAVALMYQILPTGGNNFGDLLADIALALVTYVVFPVLGGVIGFYISDIATSLKDEKLEA